MRKITVKGIEKSAPGRYRDVESRGLYLQVGPNRTKSWLLRFELNKRERFMGLGGYPDFSLKQARERARAARQLLADGIDPIEAKEADRAKRALESAKNITFEQAARQYEAQHGRKWKNRKAAAQFLSTLSAYVFPVIGALPVGEIDTGLLLRVFERDHPEQPGKTFWEAVPETASRVRGRIENVLDWATVRRYRVGDNPARWRGNLEHVLPARSQIAQQQHHAALPYAEIPEFCLALGKREGSAARALEFTILTAARTSETIGAKWGEIDLKEKVWTIPAGRMKASREHRVPLSDRALSLLRDLPSERHNDHVFFGPSKGAGLSNMAMASVLKRMGRASITVHGFRSTFRDWAAERTNYPNHVVEMALAHVIGDKVEAAYRRGDLFEKRRKLMAEWAKYCITGGMKTGTVISIRQAAS